MINEVVEEPLSVDRCLGAVRRPDCGGIAVFLGVVRDNTDGVGTAHLEYEAYPEMAVSVVDGIVQAARSRWEVGEIAVQHRVGRLEIGEASVIVAVSAPHRGSAFEACRYVIDKLKTTAPIWKKEFGEGGEMWVEGPTSPEGRSRGDGEDVADHGSGRRSTSLSVTGQE